MYNVLFWDEERNCEVLFLQNFWRRTKQTDKWFQDELSYFLIVFIYDALSIAEFTATRTSLFDSWRFWWNISVTSLTKFVSTYLPCCAFICSHRIPKQNFFTFLWKKCDIKSQSHRYNYEEQNVFIAVFLLNLWKYWFVDSKDFHVYEKIWYCRI